MSVFPQGLKNYSSISQKEVEEHAHLLILLMVTSSLSWPPWSIGTNQRDC
ncbi:hypothetical protein [Streptococcus lactarius]